MKIYWFVLKSGELIVLKLLTDSAYKIGDKFSQKLKKYFYKMVKTFLVLPFINKDLDEI